MTLVKNHNKKADLLDLHIGQKIKDRRIQIGLSQSKISDKLGITFQQFQKYETGKNRIPVSRLYKLLNILEVSFEYFFIDLNEFLNENNNLNSKNESKNDYADFKEIQKKGSGILNNEILKLNRFFTEIKDKNIRKMAIEIVKIFGRIV